MHMIKNAIITYWGHFFQSIYTKSFFPPTDYQPAIMLTGSRVFLVERGYNADTDVDHQMTSDVNKCRDVTKRNASLHIYIYGTPTC